MIDEVEQVVWQKCESLDHCRSSARGQLPPSRKHIQHATQDERRILHGIITRFDQYELLSGSQSKFKVLYSGVSQSGLRTLIGRPMVKISVRTSS